jgi:hypothetical protein
MMNEVGLYLSLLSPPPKMTNSSLNFCISLYIYVLWHIFSKQELWYQYGRSVLGNGSANTSIARQCLSNRHVIAATVAYAEIGGLLEAVFSVESVPRQYNEEQLPLWDSIRDKPIFTSERTLHKDYDRKGTVIKKKQDWS